MQDPQCSSKARNVRFQTATSILDVPLLIRHDGEKEQLRFPFGVCQAYSALKAKDFEMVNYQVVNQRGEEPEQS